MNETLHNEGIAETAAGTKYPAVAIVILNWNGQKFLEQFLPSVMASAYTNKRIIVADNASSDDSISFLKAHYPQVEILINSSNEGFAKGYNTALQQVSSDYYVLLNSDVEVTPDWIQPVIDLMETDIAIAACQPKLLAYNNKSQFEYAGASGGWIDTFGYPFLRGRIFDICETDHGQYNNAQQCFWASGAALFVKAKVYHEMGGWMNISLRIRKRLIFAGECSWPGIKCMYSRLRWYIMWAEVLCQKAIVKKHTLITGIT